jgi:integrase
MHDWGAVMRKLLSQRLAERSKPKDKPYQIHDTAIPGLVLRVQPSGTKVWKLIQNRKPRTLGQMPITTFGMAKAKAERILRGEDDDSASPPMTFEAFLQNQYEAFVKANHAAPDDTLQRLRRFEMGDKLLDEVKLADIETWRTKRQQDGRAASTINRDTGALRAAFSKAVEWDLLEAHPMTKFKVLRVDKRKKPRYLLPAEEKALYTALIARDERKCTARQSANEWRRERRYPPMPELGTYCDNLTPMVVLAINTGLRRGELWNLEWGDVDLKRKMLTVHGRGAKSGQTRHVPLNAAAVDVMKKHRGDAVPLPHKSVFGRAEFRKAWNKVLKDAMITGFRFHDLRHTFASKLVMAGVPLNTTRELMGHGSIDMTLVYAHLSPDNLQDAVDLISPRGVS